MLKRIEILAHRGFWVEAREKNQIVAFIRAFEEGFGVETDIRDLDGQLVISHDPPTEGCMTFDSFLDLHARYGRPGTLALNVKSDGLTNLLKSALQVHPGVRYFVFDMSVPDSLGYLRSGIPTLTRRSEFEGSGSLDDQASGIWFDHFGQGHSSADDILSAIEAGKLAAVVSPELHGRPHEDAWNDWRSAIASQPGEDWNRFLLCTDFPVEARSFFSGVGDPLR